jgi:D-alanyl-lipoteichoic acid acyltransferase DltB (MBOAT superfamily)
MTFNSYTFVALFLVAIAVSRGRLPWTAKKVLYLVLSIVFYAGWRFEYCLLLAVPTVIDWFVARRMVATADPRVRRLWLIASCVSNLGLLAYFKYAGFVVDNLARALAFVGVDWSPAPPDVLLPIGISFYTFEALSYTIDVYRGVIPPARRFLDYALFMSFFPRLVAGPIMRAAQFLPQLEQPRRASRDDLGWGATLVVLGLWEKVVLADGLLAPTVEAVYALPGSQLDFVAAWTGTLAFAGQIFFDFAGYSTCAIGVARCLGFRLVRNFWFPYAALGFSDFWRRWHISLSTWLRDYVYIPLGGNRGGRMREYRNLMITMMLGGLWHGAAWNFVAWGTLHGGLLVAERLLRERFGPPEALRGRSLRAAGVLLTFVVVCFTWVCFRAPTLEVTFRFWRAMLSPDVTAMLAVAARPMSLMDFRTAYTCVLMAVLLVVQWRLRERDLETAAAGWSWQARGVWMAAMLFSLTTMAGEDRAFIYFQF